MADKWIQRLLIKNMTDKKDGELKRQTMNIRTVAKRTMNTWVDDKQWTWVRLLREQWIPG